MYEQEVWTLAIAMVITAGMFDVRISDSAQINPAERRRRRRNQEF
jgi:hypothetical protein